MLLFFKRLAKSNGYIYFFLLHIYNNYNRFISKLKTEIILHSNTCKIQYDIIGKKNKIIIGKDTIINKLTIHIRGNNNILDIGNKCFFGENCLIWMEGDNCEIKIGDHTTSTRDNEFNAQEYKSKITIGNDCMISNNVTIRTSDSHPYFDIQSGTRLNIPQNINIGNHVWIAPNTKIMKGAIIKDGAIIGSDTTISKEIPTNSLAIGRPAKIIRTNIRWSREALF